MADLTVSANVDSFMQAANYAAMRTLLNVEDGATADQTGAEIDAALDTLLGHTNWTLDWEASGVGTVHATNIPDLSGTYQPLDGALTALAGGALDADLDVAGFSLVSSSNGDITLTPNGTGDVVLGNYTLDADATVGASQDNYVMTYDHSAGKWGPEASAGGSDLVNDLTPQLGGPLDLNGQPIGNSTGHLAEFYNSTNAYEMRIFNTRADVSNGEWLELGFQDTTNTAVIKTNANGMGTGTERDLTLGGAKVRFAISGTTKIFLSSSVFQTQVNIEPGSDSVRDLGNNLARWRDFYIGRYYYQSDASADPADPANGSHVIWQSDSTGSGDDGDIMLKITDSGGTTKTITLVDFSAF